MAQKTLKGGEWRSVRCYKPTKRRPSWRAVTQWCDPATGEVRQRSKTGETRGAAVAALEKMLADDNEREPDALSAGLDATTPVSVFAAEMFTEKEALVAAGEMSPGSLRTYKSQWTLHIKPVLGDLPVKQVTVLRCDQFLKKLRRSKGYATVKGVRSVLTGIMAIPERYGLVALNPVSRAANIPGDGSKSVRALSASEAVDVWQRLTVLAAAPNPKAADNRRYRPTLCDPLVPDLWLWMLGTGDRIGNALAARWRWIDMESGTARLGPNVIRVPGEGLRISEGTSKSREVDGVDLPEHVLTMLLARQELPGYSPMGLVFPDAFGDLLDPSNVSSKKLRPALQAIGCGHLSSHWCRRTLGSELNAAGLTLMQIAGRLRHADSRTTEKHYVQKRGGDPRVKAAIEAMLDTAPERKVVPLSG